MNKIIATYAILFVLFVLSQSFGFVCTSYFFGVCIGVFKIWRDSVREQRVKKALRDYENSRPRTWACNPREEDEVKRAALDTW